MSCNTNTNNDVMAIRLMIRNAIPFPLSSSFAEEEINSKIRKSVLADRHENTMSNAKGTNSAASMLAVEGSWFKYAIAREITPDMPPDTKAVFAFMPMKMTETIPQAIKKNP